MPKAERCPFCDASVKPENLIRHLDANHPRNTEAKAMREDLRRSPARTSASRGARGFRLRRTHLAVILAVIVLALGAYYVAPLLSPSATDVVGYCGGEGTVQHYHTLLVIEVNGLQKEVPADIGITAQETNPAHLCPSGELHALHTHDGSGVIHNELPGAITVTPRLGDFFEIWGQQLNPAQVWSYAGHVSAVLADATSGHVQDYSSDPGSIPLPAPSGGRESAPIPQNLIFGGAYGTGESNGVFSGEIIYLNVTVG